MTDTTQTAETTADVLAPLDPEPDPIRRAVTRFLAHVAELQRAVDARLADPARYDGAYPWAAGAYEGAISILRIEVEVARKYEAARG